jgi:hypothetical protein
LIKRKIDVAVSSLHYFHLLIHLKWT